jgi:hypothetical protein
MARYLHAPSQIPIIRNRQKMLTTTHDMPEFNQSSVKELPAAMNKDSTKFSNF